MKDVTIDKIRETLQNGDYVVVNNTDRRGNHRGSSSGQSGSGREGAERLQRKKLRRNADRNLRRQQEETKGLSSTFTMSA